MMRVLVTGGAGYIGSVVGDALVRSGQEVVVFDNLSKGRREGLPRGVTFVQGDLENSPMLRKCLSEHRIDAVVHMAAYSLVGESVTDPARYYRNNLLVGIQLLDAMRECHVSAL